MSLVCAVVKPHFVSTRGGIQIGRDWDGYFLRGGSHAEDDARRAMSIYLRSVIKEVGGMICKEDRSSLFLFQLFFWTDRTNEYDIIVSQTDLWINPAYLSQQHIGLFFLKYPSVNQSDMFLHDPPVHCEIRGSPIDNNNNGKNPWFHLHSFRGHLKYLWEPELFGFTCKVSL